VDPQRLVGQRPGDEARHGVVEHDDLPREAGRAAVIPDQRGVDRAGRGHGQGRENRELEAAVARGAADLDAGRALDRHPAGHRDRLEPDVLHSEAGEPVTDALLDAGVRRIPGAPDDLRHDVLDPAAHLGRGRRGRLPATIRGGRGRRARFGAGAGDDEGQEEAEEQAVHSAFPGW